MKLINIRLKNYRNHIDDTYRFNDGITLIQGPNGAGKTNVIEAIAWTMFGGKSLLTRTTQKDIVRRGKPEDEQCFATLRFRVDNNIYKIKRGLYGKHYSHNVRVRKNGTIVADGSTATKEFIYDLTRMEYTSFIRSLYCAQTELSALTDATPSKRKKAIMKMLNVYHIEKILADIRKTGREKIKDVKHLRNDKEEELKDKINDLHEELDRTKKEKELIEGKKNEAIDMLYQKNEAFDIREKEYQTYIRKIDKMETEISELKNNKATNDALMKNAQNKLEELEWLESTVDEDKYNEYITLKSMSSILSEYRNLESDMAEAGEHILDTATLNKYENLIFEMEEEIERGQKTINESMAVLEIKESEKNRLIDHIESLEDIDQESSNDAGSICPTCGTELDNVDKIISQYKETLQKLEDNVIFNLHLDIEASERMITENKKDLPGYKYAVGEHHKATKEIKKFKREIRELKNNNSEVDLSNPPKSNDIEERLFDLEENYNAYNKLKRMNDSTDEITAAIKKYDREENRIKYNIENARDHLEKVKRNFDVEQYERERKEIESLKSDIENKERQISQKEPSIERAQGILDIYDSQIREAKDKNERADTIEKRAKHLIKLGEHVSKFRVALISKIRPVLSNIASTVFETLTMFKYDTIRLDEDYTVYIRDSEDGEFHPIESFSGGEQDLANLALRIAISQLISNRAHKPEYIIFDEIFGSIDKRRRKEVFGALKRLSNHYTQIICISHIHLEEYADNIIDLS